MTAKQEHSLAFQYLSEQVMKGMINVRAALSAQAAPKVPECGDCAMRAAGFISEEEHDRFVEALREAKAQAVPGLSERQVRKQFIRAGLGRFHLPQAEFETEYWRCILKFAEGIRSTGVEQ